MSEPRMVLRSPAAALIFLLVLKLGFYGTDASVVHTKLDTKAFKDLDMIDAEETGIPAEQVDELSVERELDGSQCRSPAPAGNQDSITHEMPDIPCIPRPVVLPVCKENKWRPDFLPQFVKLYRCQGSCIGRNRRCEAHKEQPIHFRVTGTGHDTEGPVVRSMTNHTSCSCPCEKAPTCTSTFPDFYERYCRCNEQKKEISMFNYFGMQ